MDKGLKDALYVILILVCIIVVGITVSRVTGDDGSGCPNWNDVVAGAVTDCYSPFIYHQQQILIEEQNQTNNLLIYSECQWTPNYSKMFGFSDNQYDDSQFKQCVNKLRTDTK